MPQPPLDPVVEALQQLIDSRALRHDQFFYIYLRNVIRACMDGSKMKWDDEILEFCATVLYHGGGHLINLLRGAGFENKESLDVDFSRFNFLLPSLRGIIKNRPAYTIRPGSLSITWVAC